MFSICCIITVVGEIEVDRFTGVIGGNVSVGGNVTGTGTLYAEHIATFAHLAALADEYHELLEDIKEKSDFWSGLDSNGVVVPVYDIPCAPEEPTGNECCSAHGMTHQAVNMGMPYPCAQYVACLGSGMYSEVFTCGEGTAWDGSSCNWKDHFECDDVPKCTPANGVDRRLDDSDCGRDVILFKAGDHECLQVFHISEDDFGPDRVINVEFDSSLEGKTILINVDAGDDGDVIINGWGDFIDYDGVGSHGFDPILKARILWNFYNTDGKLMLGTGSGGPEMPGSVIVPHGDVWFGWSGQSGRLVVGGDLVMESVGGELHNYDFNPPCNLPLPCYDYPPYDCPVEYGTAPDTPDDTPNYCECDSYGQCPPPTPSPTPEPTPGPTPGPTPSPTHPEIPDCNKPCNWDWTTPNGVTIICNKEWGYECSLPDAYGACAVGSPCKIPLY